MLSSEKRRASDHVKIALHKYIKQMNLREGTKLPTERELAALLAVSRSTVRDALEDMEAEGLVIRQHGKGTFANPEALHIQVNVNPGPEFARMIRKSGHKERMELASIKRVPADKKISGILRIDPETPVVLLEKIFYADEIPAIICIDRFPEYLLEGEVTEDEYRRFSTFDILKERAHRLVLRDKVEMEALAADQLFAYSREVKKMACQAALVFHGINYDQDNLPVVYDTEIYDTNYIRFNMMRQKRIYEYIEE